MLKQKMLQDIKQNKWQFISVMIMAFLGVFIFTGIGGEWAGVDSFRKGYYEQTNLADGWIWGEGFSNADVNKVKNIDGITGAEKRCYVEVTGQDKYNPTVYLYGLEKNSICKPLVVEGEEFNPDVDGKVWLDKQFADTKGLKLGDEYTFVFEGTPFSLKIAGLIYSSEYQYYANENDLWPDYNTVGFAYCSYKSLPIKDYIINYVKNSDKSVEDLIGEFADDNEDIKKNANLIKRFSKDSIINIIERADASEFAEMTPFTQIIFTSSVDAKDLSDEIDEVLKGSYAVFTTRAETEGIMMLDAEMSQHKMMGAIFPVAFLIIAILAIITSMNRLVNNQRTQIGTLKALGFGKAKITLHYVNYGFWVSLIGAVLGCIIGPLTLPHLFYGSMSSYFALPEWKSGFDISFILVAVVTVLACTLTTFLTVYKVLGDTPAATLRPKAPKNFKISKIEKSAVWSKMNFNFRWSWRSFIRGKARTLMGIVGTVSCMALLVGAFSMYDCMDDMEHWMYNEIQVQQTRLTLDSSVSIKEAESIAKNINGELIMTSPIEIRANGVKKTQTVTVADGEGCFYITDSGRKQIAPDNNTIALSLKAANALGLKEGDEFEWHIYTSDKWVKSKVSIICRTPMTQGLVITRNTLESLGCEFNPTYVDTLQKLNDYKSDSVINVLTADDMHNFWSNYMETMNMMVAVLILFALILAVVVLYNLGQLTFTEKERENATLKVIGFSTGRILNLNLIQNLIFAVAGVIFGVPCGLGLVSAVIKSAGDEFDMMVNLSAPSFFISAGITIGVSLLVSLLFRKNIKKLDMVTSLKGVE
ncbi:MAG: ABC transporter permease [Acetobacter sp.]|nr:ABC transporter permease [Bacteroides sp.]MCM1341790.1 ABC transporter permease [Acetobacter sp.]MCM1433132.1 ABC transporter permease [Clostridiales bacterium]